MAFDAGKLNEQKVNDFAVEVNITDNEGKPKTLRYRLRRVSRGEMVKMLAIARSNGQDNATAEMLGMVFETGDELGGGMSVYELIDGLDAKKQSDFMEYVTNLAMGGLEG